MRLVIDYYSVTSQRKWFASATFSNHSIVTREMADEEEYVQLTIPEAFIYKVPPRTSAQGHK